MKSIEKKNKAIAEFMGGRFIKATDDKSWGEILNYWQFPDGVVIQKILKYNSSWDWLMPVLFKVMKEMEINIICVAIQKLESYIGKPIRNIIHLHEAIYRFITQTNERHDK